MVVTAPQPAPAPQTEAPADRWIHCLSVQTGPLSCAAFAPDCRRALATGPDGALQLWDLQEGKELAHLADHPVRVLGLGQRRRGDGDQNARAEHLHELAARRVHVGMTSGTVRVTAVTVAMEPL